MAELVKLGSRLNGYVPSNEPALRSFDLNHEDRVAAIARHEARCSRYASFPDQPRILLLEPYYPPSAKWGSLKVEQGFLPPLGLISIYRWLKEKRHNVTFIDTQFGDFTLESLKRTLSEGRFDLVGLPLFTPTAGHVFDTSKIVREVLPSSIILFGGVHATSMSAESLDESPEADFVIRREGELTITELIDALIAHKTDFSSIAGLTWHRDPTTVALNPDRTLLPELDELPLGMFGDLDLSRYIPHPNQYIRLPNIPFVSQRGCPYPCTFCEAHVALGKKLRLYSPERVIEELKILKYEKGARGIYFQDSTFTMHRKYITQVLELMIKEGLNDLLWSCTTRTDRVDPELLALMHEAGCRNIAYGIESANEQSLKVIKKGITAEQQQQGVEWTHKARITMNCSYILCLPGETEEMVDNTVQYAKKLAAQMSLFYLPVPYPGSALHQVAKETGGLRETKNWNEFLSIDFDNPIYINPLIGKERMQYWYSRAYFEYYTYPKVWLNNLKALYWYGGLHRYRRGANAVRALIMHRAGNIFRKPYHQAGAPTTS
jgi:radical SAM superfamily enzyme YgiQ (UPF0313 family)